MRRGFTLMELLVVIAIVGILAGLSMMALAGAAEQAREQRTRAIINKIDMLIGERWESYRTRTAPIRLPASATPRAGAQLRLNALRELQRMELPDRITDVTSNAVVLSQLPSLTRTYRRKAAATWDTAHQGSECLYLILSTMKDGDKSALDFFTDTEIGDTDEDGMKEILDGWGTPIEFLRWAPGYVEEVGVVTTQTRDHTIAPDPFDPIHCDPRWSTNEPVKPFALYPLLFSAGKDKAYDINIEGSLNYSTTTPRNDPYYKSATPSQAGDPLDANGNGTLEWSDNITNHWKG